MQNKFSLWKNLALVGLALLAFFYAMPNLYKEKIVVQIGLSDNLNPQALQERVGALLDEAQLSYGQIKINANELDVDFSSTDKQLQAKDILKKGLGSNYTVVLN